MHRAAPLQRVAAEYVRVEVDAVPLSDAEAVWDCAERGRRLVVVPG